MSVIVSTCDKICGNPLNKSVSKQLFSFGKDSRFKEAKSNYQPFYYDLPDIKMKRTASMGYGTKLDFASKKNWIPGPNEYKIKSFIDEQINKKKGFKIGVSREKMKVSGIHNAMNNKIPGPGTYEFKEIVSNVKYSFRQKNNPLTLKQRDLEANPSPATYFLPVTINGDGKYFDSKYASSKTRFFNPPRSQRFVDDPLTSKLGPGQYQIEGTNKKGNLLVVSKQPNVQTFSFDKDVRLKDEFRKCRTPGPGTYVMPSDFGVYESSKK